MVRDVQVPRLSKATFEAVLEWESSVMRVLGGQGVEVKDVGDMDVFVDSGVIDMVEVLNKIEGDSGVILGPWEKATPLLYKTF